MAVSPWIARRASVPYVVLLATLVLTVLGTSYVLRTNRLRDDLAFRTTVDETQDLVEIRLNTYIELLRATAALFAASAEVTDDEFRAFVAPLRLRDRYPGIQGVGFARRVAPEDAARAGIWPGGARDDYTRIVFLEPRDERNLAALGFDMFTEPVRREAMARARDSGAPAASGKVTLVQEIDDDKQAGFLIYMPVYRRGAAVSTIEERRAAIEGWVYSPFRADDLLTGIVGAQASPLIEYEVYDGEGVDPARLLHASLRDAEPAPHERLETVERLAIAGRTWTMAFHARPHFGGSPAWVAPLTLATGLVVAFALFWVTRSQVRGREEAERHAAELRASEEALRESEGRLRRLVVLEREARATAQAADGAKDEFLATLSHELRTPLNAVLGWLSMLRTGKVRDERRAEALEVVERNARTQARLIEDLLDVSRIITGKVRLELHPLRLAPIASTVLEALRPGADAKGVRLHEAVDPDPGPVMGDAARLQQVLWNLVANAIKFTPAGGDVFVEAAARDGEAELRVRDTGIGIDPGFLPHVFERFRQADSSTTRTHSGVGLGLSIVRHLVELHGGQISAASEGAGRGATFVVRLPLAAHARAAAGSPAGGPGTALDGLRVLVVDDDPDTRELLAVSLGASGARVATAQSADEALRLLENGGADVIVSDIGMPVVDGYMLMQRIRALPGAAGRVPAIALTAYARPQDRQDALAAGYQVHLPKPVELGALHASLASLAGRADTQ